MCTECRKRTGKASVDWTGGFKEGYSRSFWNFLNIAFEGRFQALGKTNQERAGYRNIFSSSVLGTESSPNVRCGWFFCSKTVGKRIKYSARFKMRLKKGRKGSIKPVIGFVKMFSDKPQMS